MRTPCAPVSIAHESFEGKPVCGQTAVTTSPAPLASAFCDKSAQIKNTSDTAIVYVGDASVTTTSGYPLAVGESVTLKVYDLSTIYVVGSAAGSVAWLAV